MNYNSKKPDENQVKRYIEERIVGKIFHLDWNVAKKTWKYQINVMKIDVILKIVPAILKMGETWMANDISYSGTRQGTDIHTNMARRHHNIKSYIFSSRDPKRHLIFCHHLIFIVSLYLISFWSDKKTWPPQAICFINQNFIDDR
jgi:hypothetical protein